MTSFTAEQQRIIDRRRGSLLVSAGAGAGKTSVLVERMARAIELEEARPEQILAITFTDKAAAEMRSRLRERIGIVAAEGAAISTIHGFCAELLREHALAAGLDPEFAVLDRLASDRLARAAFDAALAAFLAGGDRDRLEIAAAYRPDQLEQMVRAIHDSLRSKGDQPRLPELAAPELPPVDELEAAARAVIAHLAACDGQRARRELDKAERCLELLGAGPPALDAIEPLAFKRGAKVLDEPVCDAYAAALDGLLEALVSMRDYEVRNLLDELLASYSERFAALKEAESGLDFDDLELRARDVLAGNEGIRAAHADRFEHILVDEFQDTNALQNSIVKLLDRDNVFRVGDERQSIYRFRHADVGVFRAHLEAAEARGEADKLTVNFRSRGEILDAVDLIFGSIWDGFEPLRERDGARSEPMRVDPCVELLISDHSKELAGHLGDDAPFGDGIEGETVWRCAEARLLARRVRELIDAGAYEAGEIVMLMRATTAMHVYERALADLGIPTYVVGGRGYWAQQQVADLRAWLSVLANPLDDEALVSALASPLGGLSLDTLVLAAAAARAPGWSLWRVLSVLAGGEHAPAPADEIDSVQVRAAASFVERVGADRAAAPRIPLEALIDRAITASEYDRAVLALPDGERRMANVRKLMRLARDFELERGRDLRAFIDLIAEREALDDREGDAPLDAEGVRAVRLMTIHRAKGLEFPAVCVADLGKHGRPDTRELRVSDEGNLGIRHARLGGKRFDGAELGRIKERQKLEDEEEERRIFYVAATRAQEHLILSGATNLEEPKPAEPLAEPMRWIRDALAGGLEPPASGVLDLSYDGRPLRVACTLLRADSIDELLPAADRAPVRPEPEPAALDALTAPALAAVPVPEPLAVGRISYSSLGEHARCGYRFYLRRALGLPESEPALPAAEPEEGLGPRDRGSVTHALLEHLDLASPAVPADADIDRVAERMDGEPTDEDRDAIRGLVAGFAASPLRARLAAAERVRAELGFAFELDAGEGRSLLVNGFVDVHATEADRVVVVDYKTDRLGERTVEEATERYATQRLVYALAALRAGAERVEVVYAFLERPLEPVSAVYEAADADRLDGELGALALGVIERRFPVAERPDRWLCEGCPGRGTLCSHPLEDTLADPV